MDLSHNKARKCVGMCVCVSECGAVGECYGGGGTLSWAQRQEVPSP